MVSKNEANGNWLPLPKEFASSLNGFNFIESDECLFLKELNLKEMLQKMPATFMTMRLKAFILERSDSYTREWLTDTAIGSYDYSQDEIYVP